MIVFTSEKTTNRLERSKKN